MFTAATAELRFSISLLCLITSFHGSVIAQESLILVLGDSLSAGYGMDITQSWPALLQQRLFEHEYPHRVENASISGDTTSGGLARLPRLLHQYSPSVVIVELGANDGLRGVPVVETERNLRRVYDQVMAAQAQMLLLEMRIPPNYGPAYSEQFERVYSRLGALENVTVVPFFLHDIVLNKSLMQNDGLHPNADAQPKMLDNVWVYLEDDL